VERQQKKKGDGVMKKKGERKGTHFARISTRKAQKNAFGEKAPFLREGEVNGNVSARTGGQRKRGKILLAKFAGDGKRISKWSLGDPKKENGVL